MHTRQALVALGGAQPPSVLQGKHFASRTPPAPRAQLDLPALRAVLRAASAPEDGPLSDALTAALVAKAFLDRYPADRGIKFASKAIGDFMARYPMGTLTTKAARQILQSASVLGRSEVTAMFDTIAKRGYANADWTKARIIAASVKDQASFERACREAGIVSQRPDHVQLRALVMHLASSDPYEVDVRQQQDPEMGGPKREDGAGALQANDMGAMKAALLGGQRVNVGAASLVIQDGILRVTANKVVKEYGLHQLASVLKHVGQYDPRIHDQQPNAVDIGVDEAGSILGQDSQTHADFPEPSSISQKQPKQPGTSSSVVASLKCTAAGCGATREIRISHVPAWVAQPLVWNMLRRREASYPALVALYEKECSSLGYKAEKKNASPDVFDCHKCRAASMYIDAGAADTLGKDTQTDEPGWIPNNSGAHNSRPQDQPGTSLPPKGDATEKDHQRDQPGWANPGPIDTSKKGPTALRDIAPAPRRDASKIDTSRIAEVVSGQNPGDRFGFSQITSARTDRDNVFRYQFRFDATKGNPNSHDLQAFITRANPNWQVLSASVVDVGVMDARIGPVAGYTRQARRDFKAQQVRAAMNPGSDPAGMGSDYKDLNMGVTAQPYGFADWGDVPSPEELAREQNGISPEEQARLDAEDTEYFAEHPEELRKYYTEHPEDIGRFGPMPTAGRSASRGKRSAASISEGWGDGGHFERSVEAETAGDLWKLHQGLNGKEVNWDTPAPVHAQPVDADPKGKPGAVVPPSAPAGAPPSPKSPEEQQNAAPPPPKEEEPAPAPEPEPDMLLGAKSAFLTGLSGLWLDAVISGDAQPQKHYRPAGQCRYH